MSATVLYMSTSLDGFIAGPNETRANGLGDGGPRLHDWVSAGPGPDQRTVSRPEGVTGQVFGPRTSSSTAPASSPARAASPTCTTASGADVQSGTGAGDHLNGTVTGPGSRR